MNTKFKYGELLTSTKPTVVTTAFSENGIVIPAGNKVIIGFDE